LRQSRADAGAGSIRPAKRPKVDIQEIRRLCGEARRVGNMANTLARLGNLGEELTPAEIERLCREARELAEAVTAAIWPKAGRTTDL